jgi:uncharacterized protein (DUF488 family)
MSQLFTIGHSTHSVERFIGLLKRQGVTAVADVRSVPASRFTPQFNREALKQALESRGIYYVFLGKELGARSTDPRCYESGKVQYGRLAQTPEFAAGIDRLLDGASRYCIAIMCAEQEPLGCHRTVLVSRVLTEHGAEILHIRGNGSIETHAEAMVRLRKKHHLMQPSLLDTEDDLLAKALELQEAEIAYVDRRLVAG